MKSVFLSKKTLLACALICAAGLSAWGQPDPWWTITPEGLNLQVTPQSVVNASSGELFSAAIDDYIGVTTWQDVQLEKGYFFLGGKVDATDLNSSSLQGGYSTSLGSNRLGILYQGSLLSGNGGNMGTEKADDNTVNGSLTWKNNLALLFGSEAIGGIRFDIQINATGTTTENGKNADPQTKSKVENTGTTITSLQWGKALGDLKPAITLGFQWPEYTKTEPQESNYGVGEEWKNAILGLKAAVAYKALEADYQLTVDFGETQTAKEYKKTISGYVANELNVGFNLESEIGDKLTLKAKPAIGLGLGFSGSKTETTQNSQTIDSQDRPTTMFQIAPSFAAGAKYAVSEKWNLYTGLKFDVLKVSIVGGSAYKTSSKNGTEVKDTPSLWYISGITDVKPSLGLELHPSDNFSVEFGLNGNLSGDSYNGWALNLVNMGGSLAVNVKF
jgi:hypothetical protein